MLLREQYKCVKLLFKGGKLVKLLSQQYKCVKLLFKGGKLVKLLK